MHRISPFHKTFCKQKNLIKSAKKIWQNSKSVLYYRTMMRGRAVVAYQAHNLKVSGSIPLPATKWISASHLTGFFCAVKVLTTKGFAKLWFSIRPCQPGKKAAKTSLILRFSLKQRDMSFREWVFITPWTTPSNKILRQGWFLIVIAPRKSFFREKYPVCATFV